MNVMEQLWLLWDEGETEVVIRDGRGLTVLIGAGEARWVDPTFAGTISVQY
jgi:hypothetical protein